MPENMTQNESTSKANLALRELWSGCICQNRWPAEIPCLWPLQYQPMQPHRLLFIGLNPSHQDDDAELLSVRHPPETDLASAQRAAEVLRRDEVTMGLHGGRIHPYFAQFARFSPDGHWSHIDLLGVRHTNQGQVAEVLNLQAGLSACKFTFEQAQVAMTLASELLPPAVVVVNALASDLLMTYLARQDHALHWDDNTGHHWVTLSGRTTAWFFSGMLTGQRALDKHSVKRLIWQVRGALHRASVDR